MNINDIINKLNSLYREKFEHFYGLLLFGSAARGEVREDSDIDILILFNSEIDNTLKYAAYDVVNDFMIEHDVVIDSKIYNIEEVRKQNTPFRKSVMEEGKLYAAY